MDDWVKAVRLRAGYGGDDIVRGASFTLKKGELCALLGANGSGKSTLLKAVCGLLPFKGSCMLDNNELRTMPQKQRTRSIAYLAQRSAVALSLDAMDIVLMGYNPVLGVLDRPTAAQRDHAMEMLNQVQAAHLAHCDFLTLSEGQQQLVLFARTLVRDTKLVVLDEPDSALDFSNRHKILSLLQHRAHKWGQGVLMSSHDANFALRYADHLLLMKDGAVLHDIHLRDASQNALRSALCDIYGPIEVLRHNGYYIMTGGDEPLN